MIPLTRVVDVPRWFHEVHGTRSTVGALVGTYAGGVGLSVGLLLLFKAEILGSGPGGEAPLGWGARLLLLLLTLDLCGGVFANLTEGTSRVYHDAPRSIRQRFMLIHVMQPTLLMMLLDGGWWVGGAVWLYAMAAWALVERLGRRARGVAAGCTLVGAAGVVAAGIRGQASPLFAALLVVYLVKLIWGFSLDRRA